MAAAVAGAVTPGRMDQGPASAAAVATMMLKPGTPGIRTSISIAQPSLPPTTPLDTAVLNAVKPAGSCSAMLCAHSAWGHKGVRPSLVHPLFHTKLY